jgi:hypothetical protein
MSGSTSPTDPYDLSGVTRVLQQVQAANQGGLTAPQQAPPPGALTDPFNYNQAGSNAPGLFGQTQGFWRDAARLGANIAGAANARTPQGFLANGTGLGPALAAGIGQTYEQGRQDALTRSELASQGAATTGKQIENVVNASGLPLMVAKNRLMTGIYNSPGIQNAINQNLPGGGGPMAASESGGNPAAVNSKGYSGLYQFGAGRLAELGVYQPAQGENLKANQWQGQFNIPGFPQVKTQADFLSNPQAQQAVWQAHVGNIDQNIAQTPGAQNFNQAGLRAVAHLGGVTGMKNFVATGGKYDPSDSNGTTLTNYYNKFSAPGVGSPMAGPRVGGVPPMVGPQGASQPSQQPGPMVPGGRAPAMAGAPSADALNAQADALEQRARTADQVQKMGLPLATDDPAMLRQQVQDLRATALKLQTAAPIAGATETATRSAGLPFVGPEAAAKETATRSAGLPFVGPETAAKSANSNVDIRQGGMVRIIGPNGPEWIKNPQLEVTQNLTTGQEEYTHVSPPLPGSPPGTPGESSPVLDQSGKPAIKSIAPYVESARKKAADDFLGKDTDSFIAAQNTHQWLEQMNHAADTLNQNGGFLQTGPTAPERLAFANNVNDILRTSGLPEVFDSSKVAAWEELKKATTTAGFELSSHYEGHARQAAQTIINATSAVPAATNSPEGFKLVSAGIQEAAQSAIDLHNAKQEAFNNNGDITKAETDFYSKVPAQMYARRAISSVTPYTVTSDQELNRYLPGTFLNYKGRVVQVPARPGAPAIPDYLTSMAKPTVQAAPNGQ